MLGAMRGIDRPRTQLRWWPRPLAALAGVSAIGAAGFVAGRSLAYLNSKPASFARLDVALLAAGTIVGALVVAFVAGRLARDGQRATGRLRLAILAVVAAAVGVGYATASATGAVYRAPVVLEAVAKAAGLMPDVEGFESSGDAPAVCHSVIDGRTVAELIAMDLGSLGGWTLRGTLQIAAQGSPLHGEVYVDGGVLPPDTLQPTWAGSVTPGALAPDGRSGVLTFSALALVTDPPPGNRPDGQPWPSILSGTIRWSCGDWTVPSEGAS